MIAVRREPTPSKVNPKIPADHRAAELRAMVRQIKAFRPEAEGDDWSYGVSIARLRLLALIDRHRAADKGAIQVRQTQILKAELENIAIGASRHPDDRWQEKHGKGAQAGERYLFESALTYFTTRAKMLGADPR